MECFSPTPVLLHFPTPTKSSRDHVIAPPLVIERSSTCGLVNRTRDLDTLLPSNRFVCCHVHTHPHARKSIHTRNYSQYRPATSPSLLDLLSHLDRIANSIYLFGAGSSILNFRKKERKKRSLLRQKRLYFHHFEQCIASSARLAGGASVSFDRFSTLAQ